ncbi:MAG: T9SS type A sorting domain-containing protein [Bacteroidales bacterium]|nr:T9SS type A sorting domain-containing protein [Bacteroidales bacterium]
MKWTQIFLMAAFWFSTPVFSQVIINQSDMPVPGDTLRVSITNVAPTGYWKSAMDTTWNFEILEALTQRVDTFVSATATPSGYQLFFVLLGGANLAAPRSMIPIPGLPVTQGFSFFKNSSTAFSDLGSGYTIQGLPLPAKYDIPDKLYEFPMTPGLTWSSTSSFAITLPGLASYMTQRIRSNLVDGWGTLTTPYGTFETLRVKTLLTIHDSVHIDSLGIGFPVNRNITEYKWLAKGKGIPVLQINEEANIVTATYRDIFRMSAQPLTVSLGPDTAVPAGTTLTLHAAISGGTPPYQILWNTLDTGSSITVTVQSIQIFSVIVVDAVQNFGADQVVVSIRYPPGIEEFTSTKLHVFPNPSQGIVYCTLPESCRSAEMHVLTPLGKVICKQAVYPSAGEFRAELSTLPDGLYFIRMVTPERNYSAKLQITR